MSGASPPSGGVALGRTVTEDIYPNEGSERNSVPSDDFVPSEACPECGAAARVPDPDLARLGGGSIAGESDCEHVVVFRFADDGSYTVGTL